jgi:hypothetical protein
MSTPRFDLADPDAVSFCPTCGAGYTAKATRCRDCDEELVPRSWIEAKLFEEEMKADSGPTVSLCRVDDRLKAGLLESALEEAGIEFYSKEIGVRHGLMDRGLAGRLEYYVLGSDLERAKKLLIELESELETS